MTSSAQRDAPLAGIRVLEAASGITAAYCGRILADLGCVVTRVPVDSGNDDHDALSPALLAWLHRGKLLSAHSTSPCVSTDIDLVLVDTGRLPAIQAALSAASLEAPSAVQPVVVCISAFGLCGPSAGAAACELTLQHASGLAYYQAMPVSDPAATPPRASADREAAMAAGVAAAAAALWGLMVPTNARAGPVDVSLHDFLAHLLIEPVGQWSLSSPPQSRRRKSREAVAVLGGLVWVLPCADGFAMVSPREQHQWDRWVAVLGRPAWADDIALCGQSRSAHGTLH